MLLTSKPQNNNEHLSLTTAKWLHKQWRIYTILKFIPLNGGYRKFSSCCHNTSLNNYHDYDCMERLFSINSLTTSKTLYSIQFSKAGNLTLSETRNTLLWRITLPNKNLPQIQHNQVNRYHRLSLKFNQLTNASTKHLKI